MRHLRELAPAALVALALVLGAPGRAEDGPDAARDLAQARALERQVQAVIALVSSAVVTIETERPVADEPGRTVRSGGSGVIVSPEGDVLTNDHVTEGQDRVRVGLPDGRTLDGVVVGRDAIGDLVLVRLPPPGEGARYPSVELGDSEAVAAGDPVLALGNPFGLAREDSAPSASYGIVSATHRYQGGAKIYGDALQIDAAVNPGNSGGPLFDLAGRLIGINGRISTRGGARHNVGIGFAIPAHQIALVLPDLRAGRDVARGYLGVRLRAEGDGRPGAVLTDVVPGSPAERAGLRVRDRIVAVQGRPVDHPVRLQNQLSVLPAGSRLELRVERDGRERAVHVRLERRPGS